MAAHRDDDLFKESTMTFGEHLDELRVHLFKAVLGALVGFMFGLALGQSVVMLINHPLEAALQDYYQTRAQKQFAKWAEEQKAQGLPVHYTTEQVKELSAKYGFAFEMRYLNPDDLAAMWRQFSGNAAAPQPEQKEATPKEFDIKKLVAIPLWYRTAGDDRTSAKIFNATEGFSIWIKASLVTGVVLSSPWIFYQLWLFVAAGLYPHEKKYVHIFLPFSLGLFLLGVAGAYVFVFSPVLKFLFDFSEWLGLGIDPRMSEWLSFVLLLPIGFGISFQLPLVMLFLERIGVFSVAAYQEKWRIAVLVIFIVSAILTPADPYSIFLMAVPLTVLFFLGILLCKWLPKQKAE